MSSVCHALILLFFTPKETISIRQHWMACNVYGISPFFDCFYRNDPPPHLPPPNYRGIILVNRGGVLWTKLYPRRVGASPFFSFWQHARLTLAWLLLQWSCFSLSELRIFLDILNKEEADYRRRIELKHQIRKREILRLMDLRSKCQQRGQKTSEAAANSDELMTKSTTTDSG